MVSADSLDRPVLCQPWIMDDGEPAGLTGNNSLPGGPTPFTGHDTTSRENGEGGGEGTQPRSSHPHNPPSSPFSLPTPRKQVLIGCPVATGNQP